eukprot:scaffold3666_cov160-Amphora_coffeaeformis.AAC.5
MKRIHVGITLLATSTTVDTSTGSLTVGALSIKEGLRKTSSIKVYRQSTGPNEIVSFLWRDPALTWQHATTLS